MEIVCWNCKTKINLDKAAVDSAIAKMDETKLGFFDVACASCGKANRTKREDFDKALEALSAPQLTQRELTKQTKEENAKRRADDDAKKEAAKAAKAKQAKK